MIGIYLRVSTLEQNNVMQLNACKDYAKRLNLDVFKIYEDVYTGYKNTRPAFERMLQDMRDGKFSTIIVYKLDRIGRSLPHLLNLFSEFQARKINFVSVTQNIDTTTAEGKMFLHMLMVFAEYERGLIVARTLDGLKRARREGKVLGRPFHSKDKKKRRKSGYLLRWQKEKSGII